MAAPAAAAALAQAAASAAASAASAASEVGDVLFNCTQLADGQVSCLGAVYSPYEAPLGANDSTFWIYVGVAVLLVLFAGLMSGLTLGLLSLDLTMLSIVMGGKDNVKSRQAADILPLVSRHHQLLGSAARRLAYFFPALTRPPPQSHCCCPTPPRWRPCVPARCPARRVADTSNARTRARTGAAAADLLGPHLGPGRGHPRVGDRCPVLRRDHPAGHLQPLRPGHCASLCWVACLGRAVRSRGARAKGSNLKYIVWFLVILTWPINWPLVCAPRPRPWGLSALPGQAAGLPVSRAAPSGGGGANSGTGSASITERSTSATSSSSWWTCTPRRRPATRPGASTWTKSPS